MPVFMFESSGLSSGRSHDYHASSWTARSMLSAGLSVSAVRDVLPELLLLRDGGILTDPKGEPREPRDAVHRFAVLVRHAFALRVVAGLGFIQLPLAHGKVRQQVSVPPLLFLGSGGSSPTLRRGVVQDARVVLPPGKTRELRGHGYRFVARGVPPPPRAGVEHWHRAARGGATPRTRPVLFRAAHRAPHAAPADRAGAVAGTEQEPTPSTSQHRRPGLEARIT
jgi:hypothetical protein